MMCVLGTVCNVVRKRCHDVCTGYSMQCGQERVRVVRPWPAVCYTATPAAVDVVDRAEALTRGAEADSWQRAGYAKGKGRALGGEKEEREDGERIH